MSIALHWYLPTHGDGRTLRAARDAPQGGRLSRYDSVQPGHRAPTLDYLAQVARAAEQSGFDAALTPTGTWCDDAWITTAALSQLVHRLRFLVAFRPGSLAPTLAAQQAAAFQRHTGGRLLLNVVTGGDDEEQRRFGDGLSKDDRYARTDEFLTILRGAWNGGPFDFHGELAQLPAVGQQRMVALHGGRRDRLEVYPNLWAGIGLLRAGAGTALVGSHSEIADRIAEYHEIGLTEFILSGYPHVEEAYAFGEGVVPILRERGLLDAVGD